MNFVKQIERLQLLNKLIREERTGSPEALAGRLGISKRQLFNLIDSVKNLGAKISYSKRTGSYYYKGDIHLEIEFSLILMNEDEKQRISGGHRINFPECNFISLRAHNLDFRLTG